jgi:putative phosphoribosyl transferase
MRFRDRVDAGQRLAARLAGTDGGDVVVAGLARGGVAVGAEIAEALGAPLDVIVVRKLGHPLQPELGVGAIAEGGVRIVNEPLVARTGVTTEQLAVVAAREEVELARRVDRYRRGRAPVPLAGRTVIITDDGLATGFTARAAIARARAAGASRVVLAVAVAPLEVIEELRSKADDVVCLASPSRFRAISECYDDFHQLSDDDVGRLLDASAGPRG